MLAYLPQHVAELLAVVFGIFFLSIGLVVMSRARSATIYRQGARLLSADAHEVDPPSRPVSSSMLRWIGVATIAVGLFVAQLLSRKQTDCPSCLEDPWGSRSGSQGPLVPWTVAAIYAIRRIRRLFYPHEPGEATNAGHSDPI